MKVKKIIVSLALAGAMAMTAAPALAGTTVGNRFGLDYGTTAGLGGKDLRTTVAEIINVAMGLLGIVALVIILIGGFKWMTAAGNEEKVGEARKLIFSGIVGLAVILASFAIAKFVLNQLSKATGAKDEAGGLLQQDAP